MNTHLSECSTQLFPTSPTTRLQAENLAKTLILHTQESIELPALADVSLAGNADECG
ncbi:MAG: hypothetical protein F6K09_10505 [Merismopedia sp. SIO2A8]|nr:hypothetical protein [Symploca sp. SIO2B6]NET49133.1 hypothetical protein [Merismopedia sp. SIO2A8]